MVACAAGSHFCGNLGCSCLRELAEVMGRIEKLLSRVQMWAICDAQAPDANVGGLPGKRGACFTSLLTLRKIRMRIADRRRHFMRLNERGGFGRSSLVVVALLIGACGTTASTTDGGDTDASLATSSADLQSAEAILNTMVAPYIERAIDTSSSRDVALTVNGNTISFGCDKAGTLTFGRTDKGSGSFCYQIDSKTCSLTTSKGTLTFSVTGQTCGSHDVDAIATSADGGTLDRDAGLDAGGIAVTLDASQAITLSGTLTTLGIRDAGSACAFTLNVSKAVEKSRGGTSYTVSSTGSVCGKTLSGTDIAIDLSRTLKI